MRFDIIGAGIGGLTTAIALNKKNIDCQVFEQAKEFKSVGAGIILANNAMQVYDNLGLRNQIEEVGNPISSMQITNSQLETLSTIDLREFEQKYGVKNIAIHRAKLHQVLVSNLQEDVVLDHALEDISYTNSGFTLHFKDQDQVHASHLIGADGIDSEVRKLIFGECEIRDSHQICWRGIANYRLPEAYQNTLSEAWGFGDRFGFVKIADSKVYWFASIKTSTLNLSLEQLKHHYKDYHPLVSEIINQTPSGSLHAAKIEDLKPIKQWCKENVCLIGDAAHATTPNLGQGACQAIEDAYCLAKHFDVSDVPSSFRKFQNLRVAKAHQIVNKSWTMGKVAHWQNPIAVKFRNGMMRVAPKKATQLQSDRIFNLNSYM